MHPLNPNTVRERAPVEISVLKKKKEQKENQICVVAGLATSHKSV